MRRPATPRSTTSATASGSTPSAPARDTPLSSLPGESAAAKADRLRARIPAGRAGAVDEIAAAAVYLASPAAAFTAGTDLVVDGGATA